MMMSLTYPQKLKIKKKPCLCYQKKKGTSLKKEGHPHMSMRDWQNKGTGSSQGQDAFNHMQFCIPSARD